MNSEDMLLLAAFRGLPRGETAEHPIRLHRLSRAARRTLDDLIRGLELRRSLLGMSTLGVRTDLFRLLRIDAGPEPGSGVDNLHEGETAPTA